VVEFRHGRLGELDEMLSTVRTIPGVRSIHLTSYVEVLKGFFVSNAHKDFSPDQIDIAIIAMLQRDGRASYKRLPAELQLSPASRPRGARRPAFLCAHDSGCPFDPSDQLCRSAQRVLRLECTQGLPSRSDRHRNYRDAPARWSYELQEIVRRDPSISLISERTGDETPRRGCHPYLSDPTWRNLTQSLLHRPWDISPR